MSPATDSSCVGEVDPIPSRPLLSRRIPSVRVVPPFRVENVRTEVVPDIEVRIEAILAVEVASPDPDSFINKSPAPIPSEAEELAVCEILKTSTTELLFVSAIAADNAKIPSRDVVAKSDEEIEPPERMPPAPTFKPFRTFKLFPISTFSHASNEPVWMFPVKSVEISNPPISTTVNTLKTQPTREPAIKGFGC